MKIAVVTSNANFCGPVVKELERRGHEIIWYQHPIGPNGQLDFAQVTLQLGQIKQAADRIFVDFAQDPLLQVVQLCEQPITVRLHRIEMYSAANYFLQAPDGSRQPFPWPRVENLIFVAQHTRDRFEALSKQHFTPPPRHLHVIPHVGVNLDHFAFAERDWSEPPWRILMVGNLVPKKRQYTAVSMLADLPPEFHMTVIGTGNQQGYGNPEYPDNVSQLIHDLDLKPPERILSKGRVEPEDMPSEYAAGHFILSAGNEEGCATVVGEGMAAGCLPLVNGWNGADALYPESSIWRTPKQFYGLIDEFLGMDVAGRKAASEAAREWVGERYDVNKIAEQTADIIQGADQTEFYDGFLGHFVEQRDNGRHQFLQSWLLPLVNPYTRYLEIGCSIGVECERVAEIAQQGRVIGCDLSPACLNHAMNEATQKGLAGRISYVQQDVTKGIPPLPGGQKWDLAAIFDSLEHIDPNQHPAIFLRLAATLKPGAKILINFPFRSHDTEQVEEYEIVPSVVRKQLMDTGFDVTIYEEWPPDAGTYFRIEAVRT